MIPNPPAGWHIPAWLQVLAVVLFCLTPFLTPVIMYLLKDKRQARSQEGQALVDDQALFIDRILKAAEMAPEFLEKNRVLMEENIQFKGTIMTYERRITELEETVRRLETDRDGWRVQAEQVPLLEGQVKSYVAMLEDRNRRIEELSTSNRDLSDKVTALELHAGG